MHEMKTAARLAPLAFVALMPGRAEAHVKWFSEFSFTDRPLSFDEIASVTFWGLLALSVAELFVPVLDSGEWICGSEIV